MDVLDDYLGISDVANSETMQDSELHAYVDTPTVIESVSEASSFFNIDNPIDIHEEDTTGVYIGAKYTKADDVFVYNSDQLERMGVNSGDGLDLVMTHEGGHRALQTLGVNFDSHQEELCCDYLAGVRAGLNNMDTSSMEKSLIDNPETISHPNGENRVTSIEHGKHFAQEYYQTHGYAPTLQECVQHFQKELHEIHPDMMITLREDYSFAAYGNNDSFNQNVIDGVGTHDELLGLNSQNENLIDSQDDFKGLFVDDKAYHLREAQSDKEWAEWHHKRANEAIEKGDLSSARDHNSRAAGYERSYKEHITASKKCTK